MKAQHLKGTTYGSLTAGKLVSLAVQAGDQVSPLRFGCMGRTLHAYVILTLQPLAHHSHHDQVNVALQSTTITLIASAARSPLALSRVSVP